MDDIVLFTVKIIKKKPDPFFHEQLAADKRVLATVEHKNRAEESSCMTLIGGCGVIKCNNESVNTWHSFIRW